MKRTLVILSLAENFGGHEKMLANIVQQFDKETFAIRAYSRHGNPINNHVDWEQLPKWRVPKSIRLWLDLLWIRQRLDKNTMVLLSIGYLGEWLQIVTAAMLFSKVAIYCPIVSSFQQIGAKLGVMQDVIFAGLVKCINPLWVFLTPQQCGEFKRQFGPSSRCLSIPNLIGVHESPKIRPYREIADSPIRVLLACRFDIFQKGLDYLIEYLVAHEPNMSFTIVGDGVGAKYIEGMAKEVKVDFVVRGWASMKEEYAEHDVLFIPSRYEGVPLTLLEAISAQLAVVASDLPGHAPYLTKGQLFEIGDIAVGLACIEKLRDGVQYKKAIAAASAKLKMHGAPEAFATAVANLELALNS